MHKDSKLKWFFIQISCTIYTFRNECLLSNDELLGQCVKHGPGKFILMLNKTHTLSYQCIELFASCWKSVIWNDSLCKFCTFIHFEANAYWAITNDLVRASNVVPGGQSRTSHEPNRHCSYLRTFELARSSPEIAVIEAYTVSRTFRLKSMHLSCAETLSGFLSDQIPLRD